MVHGDGDGGQRARGRARPALLWKFPVCLKKVPHLNFGTSEKVPHLILATSEKFPVFMLVRRESSPKTRGETGVLEGVSMAVACFLGLQTSPFEKILVSPVRAFEAGGFGLSGHGLGDSVPRMQKRPWVADAALGLFRGMHFTRRAGFGVSGKCRSEGRVVHGALVGGPHGSTGSPRTYWGRALGLGRRLAGKGAQEGCEVPAFAGICHVGLSSHTTTNGNRRVGREGLRCCRPATRFPPARE